MLTAIQKEERKLGIGGSDIHHIFNLKPYGCRRRLWYDKTGAEPDYPVIESPIMRRGNKLEDVIAGEYTEITGRKMIRWDTMVHKSYPWCRVNVDRKIIDVADKPGVGIWECKVPGREIFWQYKRGGISEANILQLQYYLFGTGYQWGSYSVHWADGWQHLHWDIERDDTMIAEIVKACDAFWVTVENGPSPDRLAPDDKRCSTCEFRNMCQGSKLIAEMEVQDLKNVPYEGAIDPLVAELLELEEIEKEAKDRKEAINGQIKEIIGKRDTVISDGMLWYYRAQTRKGFNSRLYRKEHPKDTKYDTETTFRVLRKYPR